MAFAPLKPCLHPGCRQMATDGSRCAAHFRPAQYDAPTDAHKLARKIRNGRKWRTIRDLHKSMHPLCCDPFKQHTAGPEPADDSHHIIPLIEAPHLAYDLDNLAALCGDCHHRIEGMERRGLPTRHLFAKS